MSIRHIGEKVKFAYDIDELNNGFSLNFLLVQAIIVNANHYAVDQNQNSSTNDYLTRFSI